MGRKNKKKTKNDDVDTTTPPEIPQETPEQEIYPCYVRIRESLDSEDVVELPTEANGTIQLTTLTAQYADAIGLRFKSSTGGWRGIRVNGSVMDPPLEGWGDGDYYIVTAKTGDKRKLVDDEEQSVSQTKISRTGKDMIADLIVLGLPYSTTEEELREYFGRYGELAHNEIKFDLHTQKSRGYGFIRYTTVEAVEAVLAASHTIGGRKVEVRFPSKGTKDTTPCKLFIGRLAEGTTTDDLRETFAAYGPFKDVYIPNNFRGFGFVTFASQEIAYEVINSTHTCKGSIVKIGHPAPKVPGPANTQQLQQQTPNYEYNNIPIDYGYGSATAHKLDNYGYGGSQENTQMPSQAGMQDGYYTTGYFQSGGMQGPV